MVHHGNRRSTLGKDSSVSLMHDVPSDLVFICLVKKTQNLLLYFRINQITPSVVRKFHLSFLCLRLLIL